MTSRLTKTFASLVLAGTTLSGAAHAQGLFNSSPAEDSFYVSGFVGAIFPGDGSFTGVQAPEAGAPGVAGTGANVDLEFDTDIYFGGALGYQLPFQFFNTFHPRLELEVSYAETDIESGSFNDGNQIFSGDQSNLFIFLNNFTDIRWADNQVIIPYIGGGLGVGIIDTNAQYFGAAAPFAPLPAFVLEGEDTGFATHTTLGVSFAANDQFEIYTEARYLKTYGIDAERRFVGGNTVDLFSADLGDSPDGFTVTGGVRVRF
jgi:hypothetical protein